MFSVVLGSRDFRRAAATAAALELVMSVGKVAFAEGEKADMRLSSSVMYGDAW